MKKEMINNKERFLKNETISKEYCEKVISYILKKIDENIEAHGTQFPTPASENNMYPFSDNNTSWTPCFYTGMLWLAYEVTGDDKYKKVAQMQRESFKNRLEQRKETDTHDLGFLYSLTCVAEYKLTGNKEAKNIALQAADLLMNRYFEKAGIIQAWGDLNDPEQQGRMIIDCGMNLPLLYWASEETGDDKYKNAAISHAKQSIKYIIRDDFSTYHTFFMDVNTGEPKFGKTSQGFSDSSCWARGQAWGTYAYYLSYNYHRDDEFITASENVTNYFLNHLPEDYVPYWDLIFTDGSNEERDSSSASIAACGLLESLKHLPITNENREIYENAAILMIKSLSENYLSDKVTPCNGILLHGVYGKPYGWGVDECNIWGDYFFFEALVRLVKDWNLYW